MADAERILVVTDDSAECGRITELLAEIAPGRGVITANSVQKGLALIEKQDFEIVLADLISDPLAGTQFLNEVWTRRPKTVRFLLAGFLNSDGVVTCALGAHHFLQKPIEKDSLAAAIARADSINRLVRNERIQSLVSRMRALPARPTLYLEITREMRSPNASPKVIGELVSKDLAISARLLQVVNSAYYGINQKVSDPGDAVLLLGLETTSALILSIESFARFDKVKPLYFSMDRVWRHSQAVAHSAKKIAELLDGDPETARHAFTAGLLHDIGKLALALNFEEEYQGALKLAQKNNLVPWEVEQDVFGATHAEAGAYLLSVWGLPQQIVDAVASHHAPPRSLEKSFTATTALHLAEALENAEDHARQKLPPPNLDLNYPAALGLEERMEELRAIIRRENEADNPEKEPVGPADGTLIMTRSQLKASTVAMPSSGEPSPLVEISTTGTPAVAPKRSFFGLAAVGLAILCAVGYVLYAQSSKSSRLAGIEAAENIANPSEGNQLSNLLSDPTERAAPKAADPAPAPSETPEAPVDPFSGLKLQAILFNGLKSSVVINGHTFRLGDEVNGVRIISVNQREVDVEANGATRKLSLP